SLPEHDGENTAHDAQSYQRQPDEASRAGELGQPGGETQPHIVGVPGPGIVAECRRRRGRHLADDGAPVRRRYRVQEALPECFEPVAERPRQVGRPGETLNTQNREPAALEPAGIIRLIREKPGIVLRRVDPAPREAGMEGGPDRTDIVPAAELADEPAAGPKRAGDANDDGIRIAH